MPAPSKKTATSADAVSGLLGRAYYLQLGLHERLLKESGLAEIRPGMCTVLTALAAEDGEKISNIAAKIFVAKSTMTGTVERLKTAKLVKVVVDEKDRRAQRLFLTAKGKKLTDKLTKVSSELESQLCKALNKKETDQLRSLLKKVISGL